MSVSDDTNVEKNLAFPQKLELSYVPAILLLYKYGPKRNEYISNRNRSHATGGAVVQQLGVLAGCSCRGSGFGSQHLHGSSQLSLTLVPVSLTLLTSQVPEHIWCTDTHSGTQTHKIKQKK